MEFIDLKKQYRLHQAELDRAVLEVLASGRFIGGPAVTELEERLAAYVGSRRGIGVGSGTDALILALMALGLKPGDEVICPAFTFIATAASVSLLGGVPVFVDVERTGGGMDPAAAAAAITERTVGVIAVDLFGQCARLEELEVLCGQRGLWLVEDAAQSFGSTRLGRRACSFGQIGLTSFFPAKPLGAYGEAGMIFTDDDALAENIKSRRNHGDLSRYDHHFIGFNGRLDSIQAAVLLVKFGIFPEEIAARRRAAEIYDQALAGVPGVATPVLLPGNDSVWAQYTIQVDDRDGLARHLADRGIPTAVHYPTPLNRQPVFSAQGLAGSMPVAEEMSRRVLSLPMHPYLEAADQARVAAAIGEFQGLETSAAARAVGR